MKTKTLVWMIVIILGVLGIASLIYTSYAIYDIKSYDIVVEVSDVNEANTEESLDFGKIMPNNVVEKRISLEHVHDKTLLVVIKPIGYIEDWISVSDTEFLLNPGEIKEVKVFVTVPADAENKEYNSDLKIILKRT